MNKYRILEVEGEYQEVCSGWLPSGIVCPFSTLRFCTDLTKCEHKTRVYIRKFIVQEYTSTWVDVQSFECLEKARLFKHHLDLKNGGIIIE